MKRTTFYSIHKNLNARLVEFAGYEMPVQYSSIIAEHKAVRQSVGVFDVSHMGEVFVRGEKAFDFVQEITINDVEKLFPGRVQYSAMCYEDGGIVDDLLVYCISENEYLLVINASNIAKDFAWMQNHNSFGVELVNESDDYSLLAVQGPNSKKIIEKLYGKEIILEYYHFFSGKVLDVEMIVSRTGYTGELGYELYFKGDEQTAEKIWNALFEAGKVFDIQPVGLGARDSLRLEMGYCLYGNDIDKTTNPLEAGLGWITRLSKPHFIGKQALLEVKKNGLKRKLTPLVIEERAFPRHGYPVAFQGKEIGAVTSGTVSPVLEKGIALAYLSTDTLKETKEVQMLIRGKEVPAQIGRLPFISK